MGWVAKTNLCWKQPTCAMACNLTRLFGMSTSINYPWKSATVDFVQHDGKQHTSLAAVARSPSISLPVDRWSVLALWSGQGSTKWSDELSECVRSTNLKSRTCKSLSSLPKNIWRFELCITIYKRSKGLMTELRLYLMLCITKYWCKQLMSGYWNAVLTLAIMESWGAARQDKQNFPTDHAAYVFH
jgi:hypothetical protein